MERGLYLPGRYAREQRTSAEAMRKGEEPPRVTFFDVTQSEDERELTKALKAAGGKNLILPWNVFSERTKKRAEQKGLYKNEFNIYSEDILALDRAANNETAADNPENYLIAHFPWLRDNSFVKVPRHEEFKRIAQSRETGITSEEAQARLAQDRFLVIGGGVGGWIAKSLARAGAEHVTLIDGSPIKPHRGNRIEGPFVPAMGENQATYYVKQMLEINPFGNYEAIPKFIGDPLTDPDAASMDELLNGSDFIFQEIDKLDIKGEIHMRAREKRKLAAQITDAGSGTIVLLDDPTFQEYPFNGRLTPEVHAAMQQMDPNDKDTFLQKAVEVYMGYDNISPEFADALRISKEKGYTHIPQSGRAASRAGADAVNLFCDLVDGKITGPYERLVA